MALSPEPLTLNPEPLNRDPQPLPQTHLAPADRERRARVPKDERQFWSDKNDFCRCLEVVYDEVLGKLSKRQKKLAADR